MKKIIITFCLAMLLVPTASYGWSKFGHQIVVAVAQRHLTKKAQANIEKIMPYDMKVDAGWMDRHRKDSLIKHTNYWHCYDADANCKYDPNKSIRRGDAMRGVLLADYNLSNLDAMSDSLKLLSLRMIIHFAGDFHCPVHVRYNDIKMRGDWYMGEKKWGNFHHVYDGMPSKLFKGKSPDEVAEYLDSKVKKDQIKKWQSGTFVDWFDAASKGNRSIYEINPPCTEKGRHQLNPKTVELSRANIEEQLTAAGYQLALLLNKYFDK